MNNTPSDNGLRAEMHRLLDTALNMKAKTDSDRLRNVFATMSQELGLKRFLDKQGQRAAEEVKASPAKTFKKRQARAYHIRIMQELMAAISLDPEKSKNPEEPSFFPEAFSSGVIYSDLCTLLDGNTGLGGGEPQVLYSAKKGDGSIRELARLSLISHVHWWAGRKGKSISAMREEILPDLPKRTWDDWIKRLLSDHKHYNEETNARQTLKNNAFNDGKNGVNENVHCIPQNKLNEVIELARSKTQGRRQD